jgi:hypothetical protein
VGVDAGHSDGPFPDTVYNTREKRRRPTRRLLPVVQIRATPSNSSADALDDYEELISAFNARNVEYVIVGAYALGVDVAAADLAHEKRIITLGSKTNGVDIMTSVSGLTWERAWNERLTAQFGSQKAFFLSRAALIDAKRAAGRAKDRADLQGRGAEDAP